MRAWRHITDPRGRAQAMKVLLTLLIGMAGALLYAQTPLPLPWFLGAMLACLAALAVRIPIRSSEFNTLIMRIVLGLAIGSAFSPEMADRAGEMALSLIFVFPYVLFLGAIGYPYFRLFPGFDRITAFLAAVPGGFQTMVAIGEDSKAAIRKLSIVHSTRILVIVFLVPLWIQFSGSLDIPREIPASASLAALTLKEALILVACGVAGYWGAKRIGISGASIFGPMLANGAVHMLGLAEAHFTAAQSADPNQPVYGLFLAQVQLAQGEYDKAAAALVRVRPLDPYNATIYGTLAEIYLRLNKTDVSLEQIDHARRLEPNKTAWKVIQARGLKRTGDARRALLILNSLPAADRDSRPILRNRAECYGMLSRPIDAARMYGSASDALPDDAEFALEAAIWFARAARREYCRWP